MFFGNGKQMGTKESSINNIGFDIIVDSGSGITGDVKFKGNVRIDGELTGTVVSNGYLYLGSTGILGGDLLLQDAVIAGMVVGDIICLGALKVKATAKIYGNVLCNDIELAPQAFVEGTCSEYNL